jgi:hypothetical protein
MRSLLLLLLLLLLHALLLPAAPPMLTAAAAAAPPAIAWCVQVNVTQVLIDKALVILAKLGVSGAVAAVSGSSVKHIACVLSTTGLACMCSYCLGTWQLCPL